MDHDTFMIISRLFCIIMRNALYKSCIENQTHILCPITAPPPPENRIFYEIMWEKYGRARHVTEDSTAHAHCTVCN